MQGPDSPTLFGRVLLALLTIYALALIAPDVLRIARPLGSFGLATNADGFIYDVQGPFAEEADSPAAAAGVEVGDRIDLAAMRCIPVDTELCATSLTLWGGVTYALPGRSATLKLLPNGDKPAREIHLVAKPRPRSVAVDIVLALSQTAGVLVVLGAAYLVWIRPGPMTWGFFVYVMYFNPGQSFQMLAWLQQWPRALLAQDVASCVLQAAGYTGLLLFALRAPVDRAEGRWRTVQRALPAAFVLFLAIEFGSLGSVFGFATEFAMRTALLLGLAVGAAALAILILRRRDLTPRDYQRMRWVIWGCLIGLPASVLGELWQDTSLPYSLFGAGAVTEDVSGLFYLVNGVLCLFVVEAVRRPSVVSVWAPLRRVTVLGLLLSPLAFFVHEELNAINEWTELPEWAWVIVASVLVYLISRAHEWATELADRLFDREFRAAERSLHEAGQAIAQAKTPAEIDRLLVEAPVASLKLASAAVFRGEDGAFRRRASVGWEARQVAELADGQPPLAGHPGADPFQLQLDPADREWPDDLARPVAAAPIGAAPRRLGVALYGAHAAGTDLEAGERALLGALAREAEAAYAHVERDTLRARVARLEGLLGDAAARA